ncbi:MULTISPECIES: viperin family antiviral radical SAM protein [unclassified Lentimonas]|uniref:viperin family antiviral radical SAM protein n=1 Tax=unclassified Lentimonas TaxID=2630993 RepID=UPI00132AF5D6|nr:MULTISPECIES: viperin family antiviral radical SAM protein [unclassified Lentimonas]CAA6677359.1 Unannotated [Lentimonas sp. CC4]CAA6686904.1 Unannotated [Lentimonas sp. CC6]CAA6690087.1 Unannotated [Lentimonas sp. CC19]CAA6690962.1 Unannotated [Lentimonas sp. CC10]CAA7070697.1 Unannotated [Lentimonas sp. CC11]
MTTTIVLPQTVNLHFTKLCNAKCKFCFAEYSELTGSVRFEQFLRIISMIAEEPNNGTQRRINFVGGEPTIIKELPLLIEHAKQCGLRTSIVSNGLKMIRAGIDQYGDLDMIGLSIDSLRPSTIREVGRYGFFNGTKLIPNLDDWIRLCQKIHAAGIDLKINTVVNRLNHDESLHELIQKTNPKKWKIFQVTHVVGQNTDSYDDWSVTDCEFDAFVMRHQDLAFDGTDIVVERAEWMINSYAMIGPNGCFVDGANGHRYSKPITDVGVSAAWADIRYDSERFELRSRSVTGAQREVVDV